MKDLTVSLEDRPGTLADLGEALGKAGINIEGMCAVAGEGRSIIHLLVTDANAARAAPQGAAQTAEAVPPPLRPAIASDLHARPGASGPWPRAMADAGVNIQVVYLATKNRAVAVTSDNAKARQALGM
jgi:hypothetical protein